MIPDAIGQLGASIMARLDATTRRVLEGASVVGASFSAAPVAAAINLSIETVSRRCAPDSSTLLELVPAQIVALGGQYAHHIVRAELTMALSNTEQLAVLAAQVPARSATPAIWVASHTHFEEDRTRVAILSSDQG